MELHTPEHTASHTPGYLAGIANVILIDELDINPHETIPEEGVDVSYIDYTLEEPLDDAPESSIDAEQNPWGTLARENNGSIMATMTLKVFIKHVDKQTHNIKCEPTMDPSIQIQKHISDEVFQVMRLLSKRNKKEVSEHFPSGMDLTLSGDKSPDKRKVISRILACANMVTTKGRRGPATFVIIGKDYIDYLRHDIQDDVDFMSIDSLNMFSAGLNIYVSGKLDNTVIVGRTPKDASEPGIHMITTKNDISGKINMTDNYISDVDVTYMVEATGNNPERQYLQFNILDHVD